MGGLLSTVIGTMLVAAVLAGFGSCTGTMSCDAKATKMDLPYSYGLLEGCMVKVDGRWVPIEAYRVLD